MIVCKFYFMHLLKWVFTILKINIMTGASNKYPHFMGKKGKLSFKGDFKKCSLSVITEVKFETC